MKRVEELYTLRTALKDELAFLPSDEKCGCVDRISKSLKRVLRVVNKLIPPSEKYDSYTIKRAIFKEFRDKTYLCDEVSIQNQRFDVLAIERFSKNRRVIGFEVKTSVTDLKQDVKYENYLNKCNVLYFVVPSVLEDKALEKIQQSRNKKHIGLYIIENGALHCKKKAVSNKKVFDIDKLIWKIVESAYFRYIY